MINETMARQYWPDEDAVGKRIVLSGEKTWRQIIAVVGDVRHYALDGEVRPEMYFPHSQQPQNFMSVVIRTASATENFSWAVRGEVADIDKDQPIAALRTMEELLSRSVAQPRLYSALLGIFSTVALLLAAVGIYGVMSLAVGQRTHEIGVRMALGAPARSVRDMVLLKGLGLALAGVGFGILGAFALTRVLGKLLYGVSATDPFTFVGAALLLVAVAAAACYFPARRATRVDPMVALRCD
jgi:putative ABC transport system permease protein